MTLAAQRAMTRVFVVLGRLLITLAFVALASAWFSEMRNGPVFGLSQQHLFMDAIALGVLGIACLVDSMLHAKNL